MKRLVPPISVAVAMLWLLAAAAVVAQETQTLQYSAQTPEKYQGRDYSLVRIVRLSLIEGDVQVMRVEEPGWQEAQLNLPIRQGYAIATGQGRTEVEFENGATARIAENSVLEFRELALLDGGRLTHLSLTQGTGTFYANLSSGDSFIVSTRHIVAQIGSNARFRLDVTADGTSLGVMKGEVNVDALGNNYRVTKNRALHFRAADDQILLARLGDDDAWDRWVSEREEILLASRDRSSRYMSTSGYNYGASDLDRYGSWYNVPGYGWGWQPWGISANWAPYSVGYWNYVYGVGFAWHSYEPWGWMPYHFGSWHYWHRRGWVWIPGYFDCWRPARVFYVWHNNRPHWGPLAPNDRPGRPPANLPRGTVTTPSGPPSGWGRAGRMTRADLMGNEPGIRVLYEPPEGFGGAVSPTRPARPVRAGVDGSPVPSRGPVVPAAGFAGATPIAPHGLSPEDRADLPRGARPRAAAPAGIVYNPSTGTYENGPPTTSRPSQFGGSTPSTGRQVRPIHPEVVRDPSEQPAGKPHQAPRNGWGGSTPTPRSDSPRSDSPRYDSPRPQSPQSSSPRPSPPPRYEPPPRSESPRPSSSPSSSGGWGGSSRPSSPPPRTETPRPSSPSPSSGGGWGSGQSRPPSPPPASSGRPRPR